MLRAQSATYGSGNILKPIINQNGLIEYGLMAGGPCMRRQVTPIGISSARNVMQALLYAGWLASGYDVELAKG